MGLFKIEGEKGERIQLVWENKGIALIDLLNTKIPTTEELWNLNVSRWVKYKDKGIMLSMDTPYKSKSPDKFDDAIKLVDSRYTELESFIKTQNRFSKNRYMMLCLRYFGLTKNDMGLFINIKRDSFLNNTSKLEEFGLLTKPSEEDTLRGQGYMVNQNGRGFIEYVLSGEKITYEKLSQFLPVEIIYVSDLKKESFKKLRKKQSKEKKKFKRISYIRGNWYRSRG